ncbi:uridine kinase family protein [Nocardioides massiliensis]|uniref:Uridine kinase n=1 Tax=Nocardioides massiliensis TaxID=1325935 RepID=A0ABT9NQ95_9ACTN|nr:hypothetical protein [Nocardioides massiliensis]MDP9822225.1 uridine kinase [Nocardioides massiliensis]
MSEHARVIVLAGPSGAGKSRLARRLGFPVLRLDDFYKDGDDPTLPTMELGHERVVDWDHPGSWDCDSAVRALTEVCRRGRVETPVYDLSTSARTGHHVLDLHGSAYVVAEGIFAHHVVERCREAGILADAVCVRQQPLVTFWRRLRRDLAERRKPWWVLVRRGLLLMRLQSFVVDAAVEHGCAPCTPEQAWERLSPLRDRSVTRA